MLRIWERGRQWIVQYRRRLVEVDSVLLPVCSGLGWIPCENQGRIIWPIVLRAFPGLLTYGSTRRPASALRQPARRFAMRFRTSGTSSTGTSMAVCVVDSNAS